MDMSKRAALIAVCSLPLGSFTALKAQGAVLTIDLNQWSAIRATYKGKTVMVPAENIFNALQEESK